MPAGAEIDDMAWLLESGLEGHRPFELLIATDLRQFLADLVFYVSLKGDQAGCLTDFESMHPHACLSRHRDRHSHTTIREQLPHWSQRS